MSEPSQRPAILGLRDELEALGRDVSAGEHGRRSAARRSELLDARLRDLFGADETPPGIALVALGGYGRGELLPGSDVDLLILHGADAEEDVAHLVERILYPLWDAGLRVGHAVRTAQGCVEVAAERLDAATAMLDGRAVAGDAAAWADARSEVLARVREDPHAFAERLRSDAEARRERFGSVSSLLEPELKEGSGGLRDAQTLGWLELVSGARLEEAGLMRAAERAAMDRADEFLIRARSALHLETGRPNDRLLLEQQPAVAVAMGFVDEPGLIAVDGLMRTVFEHAREIEHVTSCVFDRYLRGASEPLALEPTPEGVLRAFVPVAREGQVLPTTALDAVATVPVPQPVVWTDAMREAFFDLVRSGPGAVRAFEMLDRIGLLERYLPAWSAVRCRPQRDPYHRSSVDVHLLESFAGIATLIEDPGEDPFAINAVDTVGDRDGALLGALLHDIGKTGEGDHVSVGARVAAETLERIGVSEGTGELARFLVTEHLLLSNTATRRDLDDDELVVDVAARVGTPERLAALYLLTIADAQATGPLAWTPWRAALVRELVAKVRHVLERGDADVGTAARFDERARAIRGVLAGQDEAAVERFLTQMPRGYVLTVPVERVVAHFQLTTPPVTTLDVRTHASDGSRPGTYALAVVAADRPGLLSMIAASLTLAGLSVLTAQVFTTEEGLAVDLFEVEGVFEAGVGEERWRSFRGTLRKAIQGRLSLEARVREKRERYPPPPGAVPVRVGVDNGASDVFTVIDVRAPDRIGLLFDVTLTLAEQGLDVHLAKVATYGTRVVDAFYVRDELGRKIEGPAVAELERALSTRLGA